MHSHSMGTPVIIIVKCFETDHLNQQSFIQDNKMFEVASNIRFYDLQDLVNKKYGNALTQLAFVNGHDE